MKKKKNLGESKGESQVFDISLTQPVPLAPSNDPPVSDLASSSSSLSVYQFKNILDQDHANLAYIRNFPLSFSEKQIYQYLKKEFQIHKVTLSINNVKLIRNSIGSSTGKAVVSFPTGSECQTFINRFDKLYLETKDNLQELTIRNFDLKT